MPNLRLSTSKAILTPYIIWIAVNSLPALAGVSLIFSEALTGSNVFSRWSFSFLNLLISVFDEVTLQSLVSLFIGLGQAAALAYILRRPLVLLSAPFLFMGLLLPFYLISYVVLYPALVIAAIATCSVLSVLQWWLLSRDYEGALAWILTGWLAGVLQTVLLGYFLYFWMYERYHLILLIVPMSGMLYGAISGLPFFRMRRKT